MLETLKAVLPEGNADVTAVPSVPLAVLELPAGSVELTQSKAFTAAQPVVENVTVDDTSIPIMPVSAAHSVSNLDSIQEKPPTADVELLGSSEDTDTALQSDFARLFGPSAAPEESTHEQVTEYDSTMSGYGAEVGAVDEHDLSPVAYNGAMAPSRKCGPAVHMANGLSSLWKSTHNLFRQILNLS